MNKKEYTIQFNTVSMVVHFEDNTSEKDCLQHIESCKDEDPYKMLEKIAYYPVAYVGIMLNK